MKGEEQEWCRRAEVALNLTQMPSIAISRYVYLTCIFYVVSYPINGHQENNTLFEGGSAAKNEEGRGKAIYLPDAQQFQFQSLPLISTVLENMLINVQRSNEISRPREDSQK